MNRYFKIVVLLILPFLAFGQKFRSEIQDYNSVVNLRNETLAPKKNDKAFIQTTKHLYSYDWGNTTSSDDGLKYIVQTSGSYRWVCLNCHLRVELSQDSILLQYDANNVLVQRDTIRLASSGIVGAAWDASAPQPADGDLLGTDAGYLLLPMPVDKFHSNILGTAPYDPLNPLTGWVAPSSPIAGNTVEVKFTDGTVGNYTYDGTVWGLDFAVTPTTETNTTITGTLAAGQTIGTYTNEVGATFGIKQTTYQNCSGAALGQDTKVHQVQNLANQSGFGVVKLDGVDCLGHNDEYYDINVRSYTANKSISNNVTGVFSRVLNGNNNNISANRSLVSGYFNSDNSLNAAGVGANYINGWLNTLGSSSGQSIVTGTSNSGDNFVNSYLGGEINNAINVNKSIVAGSENTINILTGSLISSQSSIINNANLLISSSSINSISNVIYGIISNQIGTISNSQNIISTGFNINKNNVKYSLAIGANLNIENSEQKITIGQESSNLGVKTSLIGGFNAIIPATTEKAYAIGTHNYTVPNNGGLPTVYLPNVVIGASDVTTIIPPPATSASPGIEGEMRIDANYVYWYKGGQWLRSLGSTF